MNLEELFGDAQAFHDQRSFHNVNFHPMGMGSGNIKIGGDIGSGDVTMGGGANSKGAAIDVKLDSSGLKGMFLQNLFFSAQSHHNQAGGGLVRFSPSTRGNIEVGGNIRSGNVSQTGETKAQGGSLFLDADLSGFQGGGMPGSPIILLI